MQSVLSKCAVSHLKARGFRGSVGKNCLFPFRGREEESPAFGRSFTLHVFRDRYPSKTWSLGFNKEMDSRANRNEAKLGLLKAEAKVLQ